MFQINLKVKIAILTSLLVISTAGLISFYNYKETNQNLLNLALKDINIELSAEASRIQAKFENLKDDVLFFSKMPHIQGIIRARQNGNVDPITNLSEEEWISRLEIILIQLLKSDINYLQARLIGLEDEGKEIVRVDSMIQWDTRAIPKSELQKKGNRTYFHEINRLGPDAIYFSAINLNRERGKISEPNIATIRAGVPVFDNKNKRFGFVVINVNLNSLFDQLRDSSLWVTNENGDLLVYSNAKKEFGFEKGNPFTLDKLLPPLQDIKENSKPRLRTKIDIFRDGKRLNGVFAKVPLNPAAPNRYLGILKLKSYESLISDSTHTLNQALIFSVALMGIAIFFSFLISHFLTKNLKLVTDAVFTLGQGDSDAPLPLKSRDEIGVLARAFQKISNQLRDRMNSLAENEAKMSAILESMTDAQITINDRGLIQSINNATTKLFGYSLDEVLGKNIKILMPEPYKSEHDTYIQNYLDTGTRKIIGLIREVEGQKKWGETFPIELSISESHVNGKRWFTGVVRDISQRKKVESEKVAIDQALKDEEERTRFLKEVASASNATRNPDEALAVALDKVCEYTQWPVGHVYKISESDESLLISTKIWSSTDLSKYTSFKEVTEITNFEKGIGLPGRVLESNSPAWIVDVTKDNNFPRAVKLKKLNLKGAFAFPVIVEEKVVAVMEFFSEFPESPNQQLLSFISEVGIQLGYVIERHKAEQDLVESEQRMKGILDHTSSVMYLKDKEGKYILVNRKFEELLNVTNENIQGKTDFDIIPENIAKQFSSNDKKVFEKEEALIFEETLTLNNRHETYLSVKFPLYDSSGRIYALCGISTNISDRKAFENKMREAQERAEEANLAKSSFLANMSHEIRTPMNAIIGMSHLALQTNMDGKQRDYVEKILSAARSLLTIINDILDFSKIEAGKLQIEEIEFDLEEVLQKVINLETMRATEKGLNLYVKVDPECPNLLVGDSTRLAQVLTNLINNAIKFTSQGEIFLRVETQQETEQNIILKFSVIDTGIGMNQEQLKLLFQAFNQADTSTTRKYGGTGLGLSICQRLVNLMGGDINVESKEGSGSEFIFTVSFEKPKLEKASLDFSKNLQNKRVLILDPKEKGRKILKEILEFYSLEVELVESGKEALDRLTNIQAPPCSLVILNWAIPDSTIQELTREIYNRLPDDQFPKILVTAPSGSDSAIKQLETVRNDGILTEPVLKGNLYKTLIETIGTDILVSPDEFKKSNFLRSTFKQKRLEGSVLLVEDNEINQQVAIETLRSFGLEITLAKNGKEALDLLEQKSFQIVLMDVQMPVMDGYQATKEIRKNPNWNNLPIMAMTSSAMTGDREKAISIGMNDYIFKPFEPDDLFNALKKWIPEVTPSIQKQEERSNLKDGNSLELEGIDIESALIRVGGDLKLYKNLLFKFVDNHESLQEKLQTAIAEKNLAEAQRILHNLKSTSGNIGAKGIYKHSVKMEQALHKNQIENSAPIFFNLSAEMKTVINSIRNLERREKSRFSSLSTPKDLTTKDLEQIQPLTQKLKNFLESSDSEALEQLPPLRLTLKGTQFENDLLKIQKQIEKYDFESAIELLDKLSESISKQNGTIKI